MNSLQRRKWTQFGTLFVSIAALAGLIAFHVLKPDPEAVKVQELSQTVLNNDPEDMTPEARRELRVQWQRMSQKNRDAVFQQIAQTRLRQFREKTRDLSHEERVRQVEKAVQEMRRKQERISPEREKEIRKQIHSPEGRRMVRRVLAFFQNKLTAKERAELDPLIHEWLYQLEEMNR